MPKLDSTHIADRLRLRIEQLERGEELAAKDVAALLTAAQRQALAAEWADQQRLRKGKRATTDAQRTALGWRTKREVRLEVLRAALADVTSGMVDSMRDLQHKAEVRGARIYMDAYSAARKAGKEIAQAQAWANNELTRAGLRRVDGYRQGGISARDRIVWEMERVIRDGEAQMPPADDDT